MVTTNAMGMPDESFTPASVGRETGSRSVVAAAPGIIRSAAEKDVKAKMEAVDFLKLDSVMGSQAPIRVGNTEIPLETIQAANSGNTTAYDFVVQAVDTENARREAERQRGVLAMTTVTESGQRIVDTTGLTEGTTEYEAAEDLGLRNIRIEEQFRPFIGDDARMKQLISDFYTTGNFFQETGRQVREGFRELPAFLSSMIATGVPAVVDAMFTDDTLEKAWMQRQGRTKSIYDMARSAYSSVGVASTTAESLNEYFKQRYIDRYGQDAYEDAFYDEFYVTDARTGEQVLQKFENPMVSGELAAELLDFGFRELSGTQQALSFYAQNAPVTATFGALHLSNGRKIQTKIKEFADSNNAPEMLTMDPREAMGMIQMVENRKRNAGLLRKSGQRIAGLFGSGATAARNSAANVSQSAQMRRVDGLLDEYETSLSLHRQKNTPPNDAVITLKSGEKVSLNQLETMRDSVLSRRSRLLLNGASNPYMFNLQVDEGLIAVGQAIGYNTLDQFFGNPDFGGAAGALSTALLGRKVVGGTVRTPGNILGFFGRSGPQVTQRGAQAVSTIMTDMFKIIEDVGVLPRGILVDRTVDDVAALIGRPLSGNERDALGQISSLMKRLEPADRDKVFDSIMFYNETRQKVIGMFGEDRQKEVGELFRLNFAHVTGLAPLLAFEARAIKIGNTNDLTKAIEAQIQAENSMTQAQVAMDRISELIEQDTGIDVNDREYLTQLVNTFREASDGQFRMMNERRREYLGILQSYRNNLLEDPTEDMDPNILTRVVALEEELGRMPGQPLSTEELAKRRQRIQENGAALQKRVASRFNFLKNIRGSSKHKIYLARAIEDSQDILEDQRYLESREIYRRADDALGDTHVDITTPLKKFLETQGIGDSSDLRVFSAERLFANSRSGRSMMKAFNAASERAIRRQIGETDEDFENFIRSVTEEFRIDADGNEVPNEFYIPGAGTADNPDYIAIALEMEKRIDPEEGEAFIPFMATAFEADEIKRHFTIQGNRISNAQGGATVGQQFKDFAGEIESSLMANENVAAELTTARAEYAKLKFDPFRQDTFGDMADNAAVGPDRRDPTTVQTRRPYKAGQQPHEWFSGITRAMQGILDGDANAPLDLAQQVDGIVDYWSLGRRETVTLEDGSTVRVPIFDEGMTVVGADGEVIEAGAIHLETVKAMARETVYAFWGEMRTRDLKEAARRAAAGEPLKRGEYDFEMVERMNEMSANMKIYVRDKNGTVREESLVTFGDATDPNSILGSETDITQIMALDKNLQREYKKFADEVNGDIGDLAEIAREEVSRDARFVQLLERASGVTGDQLFDRYFVEGSQGTLDELRTLFIDGRVTKGVDKEQASKDFNQIMTYIAFNGMLRRAEVAPSAELGYTSIDGVRRQINTASNAAQLASDLNGPMGDMLETVMSKKHVDNMKALADWMVLSSGTSLGKATPGGIRGISPNELISRAFNIARGMVTPTYVAAEFGFRLLEQQKVSLIAAAASDENAADILAQIVKGDPTSPEQVETLGTILKSIVAREAARNGEELQAYVPPDAYIGVRLAAEQDYETMMTAMP